MVLIVNTYNDDCDNWEQCDDTKYLYKWSDVVKMIHCDGTEKDKIVWWHWLRMYMNNFEKQCDGTEYECMQHVWLEMRQCDGTEMRSNENRIMALEVLHTSR